MSHEHVADAQQSRARLIRDQLHRYSAAMLPFRLGDGAIPPRAAGLSEPDAAGMEKHVQQAMRVVRQAGREHLLVLGAGGGYLPDALAAHLPEHVTLTVAELDPERVRQAMDAGRLQWWRAAGRHRLVADTSPWALLVLLAQAGMTPHNTTMVLHPQLAEAERKTFREWQRQFTVAQHVALRHMPSFPELEEVSERLTLGVIVHPDEPGMEDFFAQIPAWVHEVVVVWDADAVSDSMLARSASCPVSVRHLARPLDGNFAAQRNAVLAECGTDWILFLDGDERLSGAAWGVLPAMLRQNLGGYVFPRWTRIGDETMCRAGFGLWPDVQLRMFRIGAQTRFVRNVHEVVQGIAGSLALTLTVHIDHYSHVWKDPYTLAKKLQIFDEAAGREAMHRLNAEYPAVTCELFGVLESVCLHAGCAGNESEDGGSKYGAYLVLPGTM